MLKRALVSPSMAVALLALLVALTGTSYAAIKINGKDIQKGSIPGNRLKDNAVGGPQVNEAQLGPVPHAQDADTLAGLSPGSFLRDPTAFLAKGAKAADSDLLDGLDSTGFLAKSGKAADSDLLDGLDSTGFVQGGGNVDGQAVAMAPNSTVFVGSAIGGLIRFRYQCPLNLAGNGVLRIINSSTGAANLFVDSGGANPDYWQLGAGGFVEYPAAAAGESFFVQMQGSPGVVLASVGSVHRPGSGDCHAQALGVLGQ